MNIKTLTGSSIQAALAEARRLLGDDVVLLESTPAEGDEPARIKVMADAPLPRRSPSRRSAETSQASQETAFGYGTGARQRERRAEENTSRNGENFSETATAVAEAPSVATAAQQLQEAFAARNEPSSRMGRGALFTSNGDAPNDVGAPPAASSNEALEKLLEAQLTVLHERLDRMERRFGAAVIGSSHEWTAHPLFATLLDQGMRPGTAARLFDGLSERGYHPDTDNDELRWALAHQLRRLLDVAAPKQNPGHLLFIGPSGTGKTSLLLKLATHQSFFARHQTAAIVIAPEDESTVPYQSPVDLYRRFGLPVQSVRTQDEMDHALDRAQHFDQVLIDTPSMPVHEAAARRVLRRIHRLVQPIMPLQVHLVLNATRALDDFDPDYLDRMPLTPNAVALTHLDESLGWGRMAEWLVMMQKPVQFVSTGPRVPDGAAAFSPAWFVEEMMSL